MNFKDTGSFLMGALKNLNVGLIVVITAFVSAFVSAIFTGLPEVTVYSEPQTAWIQLAALALSTGIGIAKGIQQKKAAKDLEKANQRPEHRISRGTLQNLAIAKQAANQGLSEQTYRNSVDRLNLGLSTALRNNILYGTGSNNTNSAMRAYNEGSAELMAADEQARDRNRGLLMEANSQLAAEEQQGFKAAMDTYNQTADSVASLRSAGDENIYSAVGTGLAAVASGKMNNIFKGASGTAQQNSGLVYDPNKVKLSEAVTGRTLSGDYNKLITSGLKNLAPKLQGGDDFWRTAGRLRS